MDFFRKMGKQSAGGTAKIRRGTHSFERRLADFLDRFLNRLNFSLVLNTEWVTSTYILNTACSYADRLHAQRIDEKPTHEDRRRMQ